jgi:uncharacterized repeat protein (TIGR03803 family)
MRYSFSICVAGVLLVNCGGSSQLPIASTRATTQGALAGAQCPAVPLLDARPAKRLRSDATIKSPFRMVYSWGGWAQGACPDSSLLYVSGILYGATSMGGSEGRVGYLCCGTIYGVTTSGALRVLHRFTGETNDGEYPDAGSMIDVNGALYGTTTLGIFSACSVSCGTLRCRGEGNGCGTVFTITPCANPPCEERALHTFTGGSEDGTFPTGRLTEVTGTLYGTTALGGSSGEGTVYRISTNGDEKVLYSFAGGSDGSSPNGSLVNVKGTLYGTTAYGGGKRCGGYGCGTIFSVNTNGAENVLYSFRGGKYGQYPARLIAVNGTLYGTTGAGGLLSCGTGKGCGTVFRIALCSNPPCRLRVLYSFTGGSDGDGPDGGLVDMKGTLYGTTYLGGPLNSGTVFSVTPCPKPPCRERVLHSFTNGSDGGYPVGGLTEVNGTLYGATYSGGTGYNGNGAIFAITP